MPVNLQLVTLSHGKLLIATTSPAPGGNEHELKTVINAPQITVERVMSELELHKRCHAAHSLKEEPRDTGAQGDVDDGYDGD